ncbi:MAG: FtsX-like permease family protein [Paracoccus sp. (in: a-proteobacteria)]|uniref:ABC transporter permease n=1 Tax=Paracoccus sp. TaxID=267 RepID=UPI0026DF8938|nr:FtsX-like permease family protein [Paracoccus sp. (in: a-proteobacteria)]MDO5612715.1 FtsX-like permease family protein [Paracoccus sp. (in: a-proteobacteria)]
MGDFWAGLPPAIQDTLIALALIAPGLIAGLIVLRGLRPLPLATAMLRRFTWVNALFVLLIAVSVGLGVGLLAQERGLRQGSARAAEPFDLIVAAPGSEVTAMLAAVYLQPSDMALVTGAQYNEIATTQGVALAAPIAFGDSYQGAPVVGTTAEFVTHLAGTLAQGQMFETAYQAVAGAFAPVAIGDSFTPAHGTGHDTDDHGHAGFSYHVTGRMAPTGSPWDRAILVPVEGVWEVHGLPNGHETGDPRIGPPFIPEYMPGTPAVLVRATELWGNYALRSQFTRSDLMAFFPGTVLSQLHGLMGEVRSAMSLMAVLTQVLVTLSVLIGLMILVRLVARSLALLRAVGAPLRFVFAVVWSYSAALILIGATLGLGLGWIAARVISTIVTTRTDVLVAARLGWPELHLVAAFVSLTLLLALVPAWMAVRRPLLTDLRG